MRAERNIDRAKNEAAAERKHWEKEAGHWKEEAIRLGAENRELAEAAGPQSIFLQRNLDRANAQIQKLREATENAVAAIDLIQRTLRDEPLGDLSVDDFLSALNGALENCRAALKSKGAGEQIRKLTEALASLEIKNSWLNRTRQTHETTIRQLQSTIAYLRKLK